MWAHRVGTLERFCPCGTCESRRRRSCRSEKIDFDFAFATQKKRGAAVGGQPRALLALSGRVLCDRQAGGDPLEALHFQSCRERVGWNSCRLKLCRSLSLCGPLWGVFRSDGKLYLRAARRSQGPFLARVRGQQKSTVGGSLNLQRGARV